jgi:hypothetical protein
MTDTRSYAFKAEELLLECKDLFAQYVGEHIAKAAGYTEIGEHENARRSTAKAETNTRMVNRIDKFLETGELPTVQ